MSVLLPRTPPRPEDVRRALDRIATMLELHSLRASSEAVLQDALDALLRHVGPLCYVREMTKSTGRPDFTVYDDRIQLAVEVKVQGAFSDVLEQVQRYASAESIDGVLLVTTRELHDRMPSELRGKPIRTVCVGRAFA